VRGCDPGAENPGGDPGTRDAGGDGPGSQQSSRNELSGTVHGPAVQARSIHGGVHFSITRPGPTRMPVPAQLPPAPAYFTGRSEELAILDRVASEYDPTRRLTVMVITGVGGSGKTSLGSYWLHRISDRYQGGILYADLRGHQPDTAARPGDVLAGFLRALGTQPGQIPLALDEQATLYRSVTNGRRMLVLLDNAASAAQVRALLPGPGPRLAAGTQYAGEKPGQPSLVVVTTRWQMAGLAIEGARFIDIGPLDEVSATALFDRMVGADRVAAETDAVRSVVRLCGGLPLAVCVAGAQLVSHARWPISRVAGELASEQHRLAVLSIGDDLSVRSAFDVSYQVLPAEVARLYRLLSLVPGPDFGLELAAAAAGADPGQAGGLLDALAGASLLEETGDRRFRFHDLVKLHAREQAQAEPEHVQRAAFARAVDWYLRLSVSADIVIIPGRWRLNPMYEQARASPPAYPAAADALRRLESELPGLLAAVQAAHHERLHEQAWQLCEALWGLFANRNYFKGWIDSHQLGIASAHADGNRRAEARMRMQLGLAYLHLGRHGEARAQYTLALALDRSEGHRIGEATELEQLGLTDLAEGHTGEAITAFAAAQAIFEEIGALRGAAMMICHIGEAHQDAGRYADAIRDLTEARRLFAGLPDQYNEARALTGLGQAYLRAGQPDEARQLLREALNTMTSLDSPYEQARIHVALADTARQLGEPGGTRRHLRQALTVYDELGAPEAEQVRQLLPESGPPDDPDPGGLV
jgi:tetratricopeptide (TPR) repeat protein